IARVMKSPPLEDRRYATGFQVAKRFQPHIGSIDDINVLDRPHQCTSPREQVRKQRRHVGAVAERNSCFPAYLQSTEITAFQRHLVMAPSTTRHRRHTSAKKQSAKGR